MIINKLLLRFKSIHLSVVISFATLASSPVVALPCSLDRPPTPNHTSITIISPTEITVHWTVPKWSVDANHRPGQPPVHTAYYEVDVWNPATNQHYDRPRVEASGDEGDPADARISGLQPNTKYCAQVWGRQDASSGACRSQIPSNTYCTPTPTPPETGITIASVVGGPGGGPFDDNCNSSDVLIGYNITSGKSVNQFAAVCQATKNGMLVGANYGLRTWGEGDQSGGNKKSFIARCPTGSAVSALQLFVNKFNELDSVSGTCLPLKANTGGASYLQRTTTDGGQDQPSRNGVSSCPNGLIAVGVLGRSGALVDSLGIKCAPLPAH
jgi:hypothetical protein